jgi:hypothetical protein
MVCHRFVIGVACTTIRVEGSPAELSSKTHRPKYAPARGEEFLMATLFARHTVADYGVWRKGYDEFDATRRSMGVTSDGVYQLDGNPNDITLYHEFATMDAAKTFAASTELRDAMAKLGVVGAPNIWFAQRT